MNPLTAYALGILTTCAVSLVGVGLMAYIDYRDGMKRLIERSGPTPPDPPSRDHLFPHDEETVSLDGFQLTDPPSRFIRPMSVREIEDADQDRHIKWLLEKYPLRNERHLFPVDAQTAEVFHLPTNDNSAA